MTFKYLKGLSVTVSKTKDGKNEYLQIMSDDMVSVNIVLIAKEMKIKDVQ